MDVILFHFGPNKIEWLFIPFGVCIAIALYYKLLSTLYTMTEFATEMTEFVAEGLSPVVVAEVNMTNDTRRIDDTVVDDEDPSWIHKDEATVAEGLRRWRRHIDALVDGYDLDDIEIDQTAGAWFEMVHKGELYYINPDRTLWFKSGSSCPHPREYYRGMENIFDYENSSIYIGEAVEFPSNINNADEEDEDTDEDTDEEDEENAWTDLEHNGELYYVNPDRTLWFKSSDMCPYPREYYPGMENTVDFEDSPIVFSYTGGRV